MIEQADFHGRDAGWHGELIEQHLSTFERDVVGERPTAERWQRARPQRGDRKAPEAFENEGARA